MINPARTLHLLGPSNASCPPLPAAGTVDFGQLRVRNMSELSDEQVKVIARQVATANSVSVASVQTSRTIDSNGLTAIEIKFVLTPGSTSAIMGVPSALTTSQVIQQLADAGEERLPIVRYEEQGATSSS
jgi:hypothetical protein